MNKFTKKFKKGFTLIEMMVTLSIFISILTLGSTSLMNVNNIFQRTSEVREAFDNLTFVLEDMARNIREAKVQGFSSSNLISSLKFSNVSGEMIEYVFDNIGESSDFFLVNKKTIKKKISSYQEELITILSPKIELDGNNSGFVIQNEEGKILIKVYLNGIIKTKSGESEFHLQTSIYPRAQF